LISPPFVSWSIDGFIIMADVPPEKFIYLCVDFVGVLREAKRLTYEFS
jgi:hypothetical protein